MLILLLQRGRCFSSVFLALYYGNIRFSRSHYYCAFRISHYHCSMFSRQRVLEWPARDQPVRGAGYEPSTC